MPRNDVSRFPGLIVLQQHARLFREFRIHPSVAIVLGDARLVHRVARPRGSPRNVLELGRFPHRNSPF